MKNLLLIEDNLLLAENIKALLEGEIFSVFHAPNSSEGIEIAKNNNLDVILCDIMLPDQDGFELFKELQNKFGYALPPFIFLTAKTQRVDYRKGMELGADDYITKPFTKEELLNSINTQLNKRLNIIEENYKNTNNPGILKNSVNNAERNKELSFEGFIFINEKNSPGFVPIKKIIYIKSLKDYSQIVLNNLTKLIVRKTLLHWESILPSQFFIRIHRQTIINLQFVDRVEKSKNYSYNVFLKHLENPFKISQRYSRKIKHLNWSTRD